MARLNPQVEDVSLEHLIPQYYEHKAEQDKFKKLCDGENSLIKETMLEQGLEEVTIDRLKATRTVSERTSFNEEKLIEVIKNSDIIKLAPDIIQTREYVDMDALENYLYNNPIDNEVASKLADCKEIKEVVTLKVREVKEKKEEE